MGKISFAVVIVHALVALGTLIYGVCYNHEWTAVGGGVGTLGLGGTLYAALATRRENIILRMLELSLDDPKELRATRAALREVYVSRYKKSSKKE